MLNDAQKRRLADLFALGSERPAAERAAFCCLHCPDDAELRVELASLLEVEDGEVGGFLEEPVLGSAAWPGGGPSSFSDMASGGEISNSLLSLPQIPPGHLGPYRLLEELGRGGQGTVYLAEDTRLHRKVALKVLNGSAFQSELALKRFWREAEVASRLEHPGICGVHDAGVEEGVPFIAMPYVPGETLARRIAASSWATEERTPPSSADRPTTGETSREALSAAEGSVTTRKEVMRIALICEKAARALHVAHEAGIIHRDIKPGNIMVTPEDEPVILDCGLAREEEGQTLTLSGDLMGTPAYMSPEQIAARRVHLDRRTDVYSLGVTLYECLALHRPFEAPTREALYQAILTKDPPKLSRLNPAVSKDLEVIVATALQKDRDRRYQTALDLAEDLRRVRAREPILARPVSVFGRAARWARRRPASAALVMVLIVAIPLLAGLSGFILANLEDIREADRQRITEQVQHHLEDGYLLLKESGNPEALAAFERALALEPENVEALAGTASYHLGDWKGAQAERAIEVLDRHVELCGAHHALATLRVAALEAVGRREEASALENAVPLLATASDNFILGCREMEDTTRYRQARDHLRQAVLLTPGSPRTLYYAMLARAEARAGDLGLVEMLADSLVSLWPDSAFAWYARGDALSKGPQDWPRAIEAFEEAIARRPEFAPYRLILAICQRSVKRIDEAIATHQVVMKLSPDYSENYHHLGLAWWDKKDLQRANEALSRAIELAPEAPGPRCNLGGLLLSQGDLDGAESWLRSALQLQPDHAYSLRQLAELHAKRGNWEAAVDGLRRAIAAWPAWPEFRKRLAEVLQECGRTKEALEEWKLAAAALRRTPRHFVTRRAVAQALCEMGEIAEARAVLEDGTRLLPEDATAWGILAEFLDGQEEWPGCIEALHRAVALRSDYGYCVKLLAKVCQKVERFEEALKWARRAVDLEPDHHLAHCEVGRILDKLKRIDGAIAAYRKAMELAPDQVLPVGRLASCLAHAGREDEAITAFIRVLELDPELERICRRCRPILEVVDGVRAARNGTRVPDMPGVLKATCDYLVRHGEASVAVRTWQEFLSREPAPAADPKEDHRYQAARAAATAACSTEGDGADPAISGQWRRQALDWMREDLAAWQAALDEGRIRESRVLRILESWLDAPELVPLREKWRLAVLSEEEGKAWIAIWVAVESLRDELE